MTKTMLISIHAPAKGATMLGNMWTESHVFQSTLPRRERPSQFSFIEVVLPFQSTLPRRERQKSSKVQNWYQIFQSTLPRRERLHKLYKSIVKRNFNPRSREGSDIINIRCFQPLSNFNPRSREGSDDVKNE